MASRLNRRIQKLNSEFLLWRQRNLRSRQKEYVERISEIQKHRLDFEAGPKAFDHVSRSHRTADRMAGIADALRRLDASADPFRARHEYLDGIARTASDKADAILRIRKLEKEEEASETNSDPKPEVTEPPKHVPEADLVRAAIARKTAALNDLEREEKISLTWIKELSETLESDAKPVQTGYEEWYSVLKRPAYNEKLQTRSTPSQYAEKSDVQAAFSSDGQSAEPDPWLLRLIKNILGVYAAPILLPLEAAFAYPAFRVLSPETSGGTAAAAGAMIFTLSLALLGSVTANATLRAFRHNVVSRENPNEQEIKTTVNKAMLLAACFSFIVVLVLVTGGADMRSKIPKIETSNQVLAGLREESNQILDRKATNPDADYKAETVKNDGEIKAELQARQNLLSFNPHVDTSDKIVAIGVYLAMFLSSAMSYVMSRDPYMEYSILAEYLVAIRDLRQRIAIDRDLYEVTITSRKKNLKSELLDSRAKLWLFDHNDKLALDPYTIKSAQTEQEAAVEQRNGADSPMNIGSVAATVAENSTSDATSQQATPNSSTGPSEKSADSSSSTASRSHSIAADVWIADRLARYTGWYVFVRGRRNLDEYASSIKMALERSWK